MSRINRQYRLAAAALAGALVTAAGAAAAPTLAPDALVKLGEFTSGRGVVISWEAATPTPGSTGSVQYELEVVDNTTGASAVAVVAGTSFTMPSKLDEGHRYSFRVRAFEVVTAAGGLGGLGGGESRVYSAYGDTQRTTVDSTAPVVKLSLSSAVLKLSDQLVVHGAGSSDGDQASASGIDPASFVWRWSDGSTDSGPVVVRRFKTPGRVTGTLSVKDRAGNEGTAPVDVTIEAPPPKPDLRLTRLRVIGRFISGRPSGVELDVNSATRVVVTIRRLPEKRNGVFVRRFSQDLKPGLRRVLFLAPGPGSYLLSVAPLGARKREITRQITVRRR